MTDRIIRVFAGSAAFMLAVFSMQATAFAQADAGLTQDKLNLITQHCSSSQFALQQIEKRDAVSRINRGRDYDQMLRQISALNSRFAYNKISAPDLVQLTSKIQDGVDKFRNSYDAYDTDVTSALNTDCKAKPADYYNFIVKARDDRNAVGDQVKAINDLMTQYRAAVITYRDSVSS